MSIRSDWRGRTQEDRDYVLVYSWGALWSLSFLLLSPVQVTTVFDRPVVALWTVIAMVGGVIGAIGVLSRDNLIVERLGVQLLMIAPAAYALTQFGVMLYELITIGTTQRAHLLLLGLWPVFFLRKRLHHLNRLLKKAKETPLASETVT